MPAKAQRMIALVTEDGRIGCIEGQTGIGRNLDWRAVRDEGGPAGWALVERGGDPTDLRFALCVGNELAARDFDATLCFRPMGGERHQAAGLVFRGQNAANYYVVRADAREGNVWLYRVVNGRRAGIAGKDAPVKLGQWHELKVRAALDKFEVWLDGTSLFTATDRSLPVAGALGVWSQGDSVTHFGLLLVEPTR